MTPEEMWQMLHSFINFFIMFGVFSGVFLIAVIVTLILLLKSRARERASGEYIRHAIQAQEDERSRISSELHDTVAQDLRAALSTSKDEQTTAIIRGCITSIRSLCYNLAPPAIESQKLSAALQSLCVGFRDQSKLDVSLAIRSNASAMLDSPALPNLQKLNIYRIVQESLNNVQRHAKAEEVSVIIRRETRQETRGLYICVADDGQGFDAEQISAPNRSGSFGLKGMRQRATLLNGTLSIQSDRNCGSLVKLFVPLDSFQPV
jgi:signal transduction histidine kinase